jgi:hypothetical protein
MAGAVRSQLTPEEARRLAAIAHRRRAHAACEEDARNSKRLNEGERRDEDGFHYDCAEGRGVLREAGRRAGQTRRLSADKDGEGGI